MVAPNEEEEEATQMPVGCEIYFSAFYALDSHRAAAMEGIMPIPTLAIYEYCRLFGVVEPERSLLVETVRKMDLEFLRIKNPKPTPTPKAPKKRTKFG